MPVNRVIIPAVAVERLRRKAKELKKSTGISHHEALDQVACQSKVFRDWHHLIEEAKATLPSEQAFKSGLIVGVDRKDADFNYSRLTQFVHDERVIGFIRSEFMGLHPKPWRDEDEYEYDWQDIEELEYFRPRHVTPDTIDEVLKLYEKDFPWSPRYVRLKGKVIDLFPGVDDNV